MGYFLMVVILIVCVLLGAVILVQNPKGGGLATGFQGAGQMGGVQKTTDFLVKATWYLTGALFVLCIVAGSTSAMLAKTLASKAVASRLQRRWMHQSRNKQERL